MIYVAGFPMSRDMFVLARSEKATDLLMDVVPMAIIATGCDGVITHWNHTAAVIFGVHKEDAVGQRLSECGVNWVDRNQILRFEKQMVEKRHASEDDAAFLNGNQEKRTVGLTGRFIALSQQQTPGYIITGADVTDRRAMQVQATHTQKMEAIGQLSAGIAHEINTPTQYVSDNLSFLKEGWDSTQALMVLYRQAFAAAENSFSEKWKAQIGEAEHKFDFEFISAEMPKAIEQANDGVRRVAKIVRAMKEFSHPDAAEKSAVDINRAIETTVTVARNEWKYVADVQTQLDEKLPPVPCYAGELNQVVLNLIINAAHAIKDVVGDSGQKGLITIRTCAQGEMAEISVGDTGTGIPEAIRSRVFDPFFTTKEVGKGTGQGLALAHGVIRKKHGGKIWFESQVGKGTTFYIHVPLHGDTTPAGS